MKSQINLLNQLQELVLTRDEHHQTGDGTYMDTLNQSIDALVDKLEPQPKAIYQRLYKKDHVVMAPMVNGCCAVCGMRLPISQVQQVRMAKTIQTCSSCGRMIYNEEEDAPRSIAEKAPRGAPRKTGISRFSAEELVCELKAETPADAVAELAEALAANHFVSNPAALVPVAMERESVLSTAIGDGLAFPHVRGVEGGGLTLALGVSKKGIEWNSATGEKANLVFFSVIPVAVSAFYLRLMAGLTEAFSKKENRDAVLAATTPAARWKAVMKATRYAVR